MPSPILVAHSYMDTTGKFPHRAGTLSQLPQDQTQVPFKIFYVLDPPKPPEAYERPLRAHFEVDICSALHFPRAGNKDQGSDCRGPDKVIDNGMVTGGDKSPLKQNFRHRCSTCSTLRSRRVHYRRPDRFRFITPHTEKYSLAT